MASKLLVFGGFCFCVVVGVITGVLLWYYRTKDIYWRCTRYTAPAGAELSSKDCNEIQKAFKSAFVSKVQSKITEKDYQPLIDLVNQVIPRDKVLFWSNVTKEARQSKQLLTLEDLLLGYIADGLTWCGEENSDEMKTDCCPKKPPAVTMYWNRVSRWFAGKAHGKVHVLLNGDSSEVYNKNSTFASVEVPSLTSQVRELHAWMVCDLTSPCRDSCKHESMKELNKTLRAKGITFTCSGAASSTQRQLLALSAGQSGGLLLSLLLTLASVAQI